MKVSIVIDNYNYEQFLTRAIDSALAQTYPDVEVIVVDDGSTDESVDVARRYANKLKVIAKENGGQHTAINAGYELSHGEVVIFLDADDTIDPETVARAVQHFETQPELSRVQWPMRVVDEEDNFGGQITPDPRAMASGNLRRHIVRFRTHVWPSTSGNAYARSALKRLLPVPAEFALGVDLYLAEASLVLGPIVSLPTPGGCYRRHGENAWLGRHVDVGYLQQKIAWTQATHRKVKQLCDERGVDCPTDERQARDVAFICQRLALLRLDPSRRAYPEDSRRALLVAGIAASVLHPHHRLLHKMKRVAWIKLVALGHQSIARRAIDYFYR